MYDNTYKPQSKIGDILVDGDEREYKIIEFTERHCRSGVNPCYKLEEVKTKRIYICPCHTGDKWKNIKETKDA